MTNYIGYIPVDRTVKGDIATLVNPVSWIILVKSYDQNNPCGASLVAQWLRVCLPMQGTRIRALVWEDPTCRGATGPVSHNY